MTGKVFNLESTLTGGNKKAFDRLVGMFGRSDQKDHDLQKLIAFRLKLDGEEVTRTYLLKKMNLARECGFSGRFFDFIKDDRELKRCGINNSSFPDEAG